MMTAWELHLDSQIRPTPPSLQASVGTNAILSFKRNPSVLSPSVLVYAARLEVPAS